MRRAARRDQNEDSFVSIAKQFGALWKQEGPLDGWVGFRECWVPVEVKCGTNGYTAAQVRFLTECKERHLPVYTWRTERDVFESLGARQTA